MYNTVTKKGKGILVGTYLWRYEKGKLTLRFRKIRYINICYPWWLRCIDVISDKNVIYSDRMKDITLKMQLTGQSKGCEY